MENYSIITALVIPAYSFIEGDKKTLLVRFAKLFL